MIQMTEDFSSETLEVRKEYNIFHVLKERGKKPVNPEFYIECVKKVVTEISSKMK